MRLKHKKTSVQQTSLLAFLEIENLGARQRAVYNALQTIGPACNQQIAEYLQVPINHITGRTMELREKELVIESYRAKYDGTGKTVIFWGIRG